MALRVLGTNEDEGLSRTFEGSIVLSCSVGGGVMTSSKVLR
jgi:hypothetical protein